MSGAGNDFIFIDKDVNGEPVLSNNLIRNLCDRHNGIGADGIITISGSKDYAFVMEYFNADGSTGSLCGNGARCALSYSGKKFSLSGMVSFLSNNTLYRGEIQKESKVKFYFNEPFDLKRNLEISTKKGRIKADFINTGSPHVVVEITDLKEVLESGNTINRLEEVPVYSLGREIRYLKEFEPGGTNVNFINIIKDIIEIRTYERGVENETLSCGTGSAAAAVIAFYKKKITPPVTLKTSTGDKLIVDFKFEDEKIKDLSLTGPVKITFTGEYLLNQFL